MDSIVYLSIPGKYSQFYTSKSDRAGRIIFEVNDFYGNQEIILRTNNDLGNTLQIELDNPFSNQVVTAKIKPFYIDEALNGFLKEYNLNMQVQNAFYQVKNRMDIMQKDTSNFYGIPDASWLLDDYTRFLVMEEVMREYISGVTVRKRAGKFRFKMYDEPNNTFFIAKNAFIPIIW